MPCVLPSDRLSRHRVERQRSTGCDDGERAAVHNPVVRSDAPRERREPGRNQVLPARSIGVDGGGGRGEPGHEFDFAQEQAQRFEPLARVRA
jgi:hypothetical protein